MPIPEESRQQTLTDSADLVNSFRNTFAGASRAAAFLEKFIEPGVKWVHLDIAGPYHISSAKPPLCANSTGFGAQLILSYLYRNQTK